MITASTASRITSPADDATDWRQLWRESVTDPVELLDLLGLSELFAQLPPDDAGFALRVPRGTLTPETPNPEPSNTLNPTYVLPR